MTQPSSDIGRRSSRRKRQFLPIFASYDLPPPVAIYGDQGPILGVGCTGVREDIVIVWYGLAWRRLSGVKTDPIRGVGCTGVWGDIVIVWYGRTWRRLSGMLTGPIRGVGSTGIWGDYVKFRKMK
ncbi:hypothetical protein L3X38_018336 [Prunus dulcis]|uniref:Uncharacterized protein n=1 Tax=Prunus dulcis TaxID=3755 RepID=A0AAD4WAL9_PRUDU|nr:hypothetical protein L3X38_018336 [Prunus dulcis]